MTDTEDPIELARRITAARRQAEIDEAAALATVEAEIVRQARWSLAPKQLSFVAAVLLEARRSDQLGWRDTEMKRCPVCGAGRERPKRFTPRRGAPETILAVDFAVRDVSVPRYPAIGCCVPCAVELSRIVLRELLADLEVVLPENGKLGRSRYRMVDLVICPRCDWTGPITDVRPQRTLSGLGTYPSICPQCDWKRFPLDPENYSTVGHALIQGEL